MQGTYSYANSMIRVSSVLTSLAVSVSLLTPALAQTKALSGEANYPPGVRSAQLLPGWTDEEGNRIAAFELELEPGWKTYWRKPGDSGLPPEFDWQASENLAGVVLHWPAPEAIRSGNELTLGYHDLLVLPFTAKAQDPMQPVKLAVSVSFGVCEKICVPVFLQLDAPAAGDTPTPKITTALDSVPVPMTEQPKCMVRTIEDGNELEVLLPQPGLKLVAMELQNRPEVWVSSAVLETDGDGSRASAEFVPPSGKPFDLDPTMVLFTVLTDKGAFEIPGCDPQS